MANATLLMLTALLKPEEVADILSVPVSWVYSNAESGKLPSLRVGKYRRFRRDEIENWLEKQRETK
jgi:excisionase family DNA binding protein